MLVLARRQGESVVFPGLDIALEILAIKGNTARVGIKAPKKITVLRGELAASRRKFDDLLENTVDDASGQLMHRIRNWLHTANLRMQLIRRYLDANRVEAAAGLIEKVLEDFKTIDAGGRSLESAGNRIDIHTPEADPFDELPAKAIQLEGSHLCRALLVEDNVNERQLLAGYLREAGFLVETAGDGGAALDYLVCQNRPDFVLLDMVMPHCDGPTLLRRIRRDPSFNQLKVFAVSGSSPATWNIPTGIGGVDRWFEKPVDPQFLVREISRELHLGATG